MIDVVYKNKHSETIESQTILEYNIDFVVLDISFWKKKILDRLCCFLGSKNRFKIHLCHRRYY